MRTLLLVILAVCSSATTFAQWQQVYPQGMDPVDMAVAAPGYVFLIAEGDRHVLKSSDGAQTWKSFDVVTTQTYVSFSSIFFYDSLTGFVASNNGMHKTTDGARTWTLKALPAGMGTVRDIVFTSPTVGYIRAGDNRMAKTTDGGATWVNLAGAPVAASEYYNSFSFADNNIGYAISDYTLYKTSNGGNQWVPLSAFGYNISSVFALDQSIVYAFGGGGLLQSINAGQNWTPIGSVDARLMHFMNVNEGVFLDDYSEVWKTNNGGINVSRVYDSQFIFSWRMLSFSGSFGCATGSDRAIVTTNDGGATWKLNQIFPQHGDFRDVHFTTDQDGFIIGEDRGIIRTGDGGLSWYYDEFHFDRDDLYQMAFSDPDTGIFVVTNNYAYTTNDGGETKFVNGWTPPIVGHLQSFDYEMVSSKIIYTVGAKVKVTKSIDGGISWTPFNFSFTNSLVDIECLDANTCHSAGTAGMVVSTWDGGAHWKVHDNLPTNSDLGKVFLLDGMLGFIGGNYGAILRTANGGHDWSVQQTEALSPIIGFHFITPEKGFAVTESGEILRTDDAGLNWDLRQEAVVPEGSYGYPTITRTFMRDTSHIYGLAQKTIVRSLAPGPGAVVVTALESGPKKHVTIYPNPASDWVRVNYPNLVEGIRIIDSQGALVRTCEAHTERIDIADLPPGLYVVHIALAGSHQVNKIIKR